MIGSRRALRRLLWAPGELGLERAYVAGDIDVDGDLADGFRAAWQLAGATAGVGLRLSARAKLSAAAGAVRLGVLGPAPRPPTCEARLVGRRHTRSRDRAAIAHHYDLSNDFYRLLLEERVEARCRQVMGTMHGTEIFPIACPEISRDTARSIAEFCREPGR